MFRVEMLPAAHGDCLWIEYGRENTVRRLLIDGGPSYAYPALRERILHLPADDREFELLVVTHIDADHIEGIVRLLQDAPALGCRFRRIWFNGWPQLEQVPDPAGEGLGAVAGEYLALLIRDTEQKQNEPLWNKDFPTPFIGLDSRASTLPAVELPGELKLTLLSPDHERLLDLKTRWDRELEKELERLQIPRGDEHALRRKLEESRTLRPLGDVLGDDDTDDELEPPIPLDDELGGEDMPFGSDDSPANGSSIAFLAEYDGKRFLFAGDAWPGVLASSIGKLVDDDQRLKLDGFKISHHGSAGNISMELLQRVACMHYLISTSGAIFGHPHERAVELILTEQASNVKPRLHFNHRTVTTDKWASAKDQKQRRYVAFHPRGVSLTL